MDDGIVTTESKDCSCPHCDAPATTSSEGAALCSECVAHSMSPDGDVVCGTHGRDGEGSGICPDCGATVDWGMIQTGPPGMANWMEGTCLCGDRMWHSVECGSDWTVPTYEYNV